MVRALIALGDALGPVPESGVQRPDPTRVIREGERP